MPLLPVGQPLLLQPLQVVFRADRALLVGTRVVPLAYVAAPTRLARSARSPVPMHMPLQHGRVSHHRPMGSGEDRCLCVAIDGADSLQKFS
jgi:hypothetical protein